MSAAAESFEPYVEEEPDEFTEWILDQNLDYTEKVIWRFHRWMRRHTDLVSGSIVDYRKYVADHLNENGSLVTVEGEIGSHEQAALNKFREFRDNAIIEAKGDV